MSAGIIWKNPQKISPQLVGVMNSLLAYIRLKHPAAEFIVTEDWAGTGHAPNSLHYLGQAVDGYFTWTTPFEAWTAASRFPSIKGIGCYKWWAHAGGLHLDIRSSAFRALWWSPYKPSSPAEPYPDLDAGAMQQIINLPPIMA
jgi:hypothetical protein